MEKERDNVAQAVPEAWVQAMLAWLEVEIPPAILDVRVLPKPGDAYDDAIMPRLKAVLGARRSIWGDALRKLPGPVSAAGVEVLGETMLAVAFTEAAREGLAGTKLANMVVARLALLKPYRPCHVWWGTKAGGLVQVFLNEVHQPGQQNGVWQSVSEAGYTIFRAVLRYDGEVPAHAEVPITQWLERQQGDWFLTRDQVADLLTTGEIRGEAKGQQAKGQQPEAGKIVRAGGIIVPGRG